MISVCVYVGKTQPRHNRPRVLTLGPLRGMIVSSLMDEARLLGLLGLPLLFDLLADLRWIYVNAVQCHSSPKIPLTSILQSCNPVVSRSIQCHDWHYTT